MILVLNFKIMKLCLLICCLVKLSYQKSSPLDTNYIAAVVEFEVNSNVEHNGDTYVKLIAQAAEQNADIIVFPEQTLTKSTVLIPVPIHGLLVSNPVPALQPDLYNELLVSMSQAARQNEIYVMINVREILDCTNSPEGEFCPSKSQIYTFNTNVVFDRTGAVIDRYRKVNLLGESNAAAMPQVNEKSLGMFTTDFSVTFGHFIGFDILNQIPAIQVVQNYTITDVIFPSMWYSEMPFLTGVEIQQAYAFAMNVNLLGAGANKVDLGCTGSGIYSGKAGTLISMMTAVPTTRLLVATVPKVPGQVTEPVSGPIYYSPKDFDGLYLLNDPDPSLPSHTTRFLTDGFHEFTITDEHVSCSFRISIKNGEGSDAYRYRATGYYGVRRFLGANHNGGTMVCSIVACTDDSISTCGDRAIPYTPNATAVFTELSINATFPSPMWVPGFDCEDRAVFPISLASNFMPLQPSNYTYKVKKYRRSTKYQLVLNDFNNELYSFAVWGRMYASDTNEVDQRVNRTKGIVGNSSNYSTEVNSYIEFNKILVLMAFIGGFLSFVIIFFVISLFFFCMFFVFYLLSKRGNARRRKHYF